MKLNNEFRLKFYLSKQNEQNGQGLQDQILPTDRSAGFPQPPPFSQVIPAVKIVHLQVF